MAMMTFSVAMKGSSRSMRCLITALLTTRPDEMLLSYTRVSIYAYEARLPLHLLGSNKHQRRGMILEA